MINRLITLGAMAAVAFGAAGTVAADVKYNGPKMD